MQPLKLIIHEPFFDMQLYMGRLYAWRVDGSIVTYNWNRLIETVIDRMGPQSRLPLKCGFCRGDYLYGTKWDLLFQDEEIKRTIVERFEQLAANPIEILQSELDSCLVGHQESPLPFPHADSIIFKRRIYTASPKGLHFAGCTGRTRRPVSTRSQCAVDCPAFGLAKSRFWGMAIAAGEQGIFEFHPQRYEGPTPAVNSPESERGRDCTACEWMFFSLYGSSHTQSGFMLQFSHERAQRDRQKAWEADDQPRRFIAARESANIFAADVSKQNSDQVEYTWGAHDKICRFVDQRIDVVRFNPWLGVDQGEFEPIGSLPIRTAKGGFVGAQTALFGIVVEFDLCLVVIDSESLEPTNLWGEPVNWRVYRHSKFYANQLQVAYDDRLEILSFNQDYFRDQASKLAGYSFSYKAAT